jgi:hypothetical protein
MGYRLWWHFRKIRVVIYGDGQVPIYSAVKYARELVSCHEPEN